jgi:serine/threonine-protein kinase
MRGYDLIEELWSSQLGVVWRALPDGKSDFALLRRVPVRPPVTQKAARDLEDAGGWAAKVHHPAIVGLEKVLVEPNELAVVSAGIDGLPLTALFEPARRTPAAAVARIALDVLEGLTVVHAAARPSSGELRYGGVCPESVLVGRDGRSRLFEVGVAAVAAATIPWSSEVVRVAYRAPESLKLTSELDVRSDVFSVGVLVWELLVGKRLFPGKNRMAVQQAVRRGDVVAIDAAAIDAPPALAEAVMRALAREPDARFAGAAELADAITQAIEPSDHGVVSELLAAAPPLVPYEERN